MLAGWLLTTPLLGGLGIVAIELLLPTLFAAQSRPAVSAARIYALVTLGIVLMEIAYGILQGQQKFTSANVLQFIQTVAVALSYGCVAVTAHLTVAAVLIINAAATLLLPCVTLLLIARASGLTLPSWRILAESLRYGLKSCLGTTAAFANFNLDILIMPAFISARSIGFYAIANSVSYTVIGLSNALFGIAMPAAVRRGKSGHYTIIVSCYVTLAAAVSVAVPLFILARPLTSLVYGERFAPAIPALRILLVGSVLVPCTTMLESGLLAINRPMLSTAAYLLGCATTVAGLLAFLRAGGIIAAAWVTTVAYCEVFIVALLLYKRASALTWSQLLPAHALREILRSPP
jgi:O-antigen/teichoic acid export membrane protein